MAILNLKNLKLIVLLLNDLEFNLDHDFEGRVKVKKFF